MDTTETCVFCQILAGELPGSFVYRDEHLAVFMDLYPVTPGHMLIVSIQHAASITEIESEVGSLMMRKAQELGQAIRQSELGPDGFNLFLADGGAAGQDVFHAHLHVILRYHGDGFGFVFPVGYPREGDRAELDRMAAIIQADLSRHARE